MSSVSQDLRIVVGYIRLKVKDVQFHFFLVPDHMCLSRMFVGDQLIMLATSYWQHVMIIKDGGSLHNLYLSTHCILEAHFHFLLFWDLVSVWPWLPCLVDVRQCFDPWGGSAWKTGGREGEQYEGKTLPDQPLFSTRHPPPLHIIKPCHFGDKNLPKVTLVITTSPCPCTIGLPDWCR